MHLIIHSNPARHQLVRLQGNVKSTGDTSAKPTPVASAELSCGCGQQLSRIIQFRRCR